MPTLTFNKLMNHWSTVRTHRKWVRKYCFLAGIPWRGITHDLSKYSPTEFLESARYWTGTGSPITQAKKAQGYSKAWLHHRGRNTHHWAYWADNFSEGLTVSRMPKDDFVEMVCDFIAAGRAYSGLSFTYAGELEWWQRERDKSCRAMNEHDKKLLDIIFDDFEKAENPEKYRVPRDTMPTPEDLIKQGYIQMIWETNK